MYKGELNPELGTLTTNFSAIEIYTNEWIGLGAQQKLIY